MIERSVRELIGLSSSRYNRSHFSYRLESINKTNRDAVNEAMLKSEIDLASAPDRRYLLPKTAAASFVFASSVRMTDESAKIFSLEQTKCMHL